MSQSNDPQPNEHSDPRAFNEEQAGNREQPRAEQGTAVDSGNASEGGVQREEETRDEELARLHREVDQANKRVLQSQADAENFRKRLRRDAEEQAKFAALPLVADLLDVRDNLRRAVEAAETSEPSSGLREGVVMCAKQLDDLLTKYGVQEIPAQGEPFDPNFHEAISQIPSAEHEPGTVAHVATVGFKMHDRVIRPSQVVVAAAAE